MKKNKALYGITVGLLCLSVLVLTVCTWARKRFAFGISEILYTLSAPMQGTNTDMVKSGLLFCLPILLPTLFVIVFVARLDYKYPVKMMLTGKLFGRACSFDLLPKLRKGITVFSVILLFLSVWYIEESFEILSYFQSQNEVSLLYETEYKEPGSVNIQPPAQKKNLIYIYMESMESGYASKAEGGHQNENLIPGLTALAKEGVSFSDGDKLGGFLPAYGTTWTAAALFSSESGVPFAFPVWQNEMDNFEHFAPGIVMLGDVLEAQGYEQEFLCGSDATFGGRRVLFEDHGNYSVFDLNTAREKGYIDPNYFVWWGFEDKILYEIAKDELTRLSASEEPFNLTMLTVDTHFPEGYACDLCGDTHDSKTANVVACADKQLFAFIEWCKAQPFYADTVIVISGDHRRMDNELVGDLPDTERTVYNCFLNVPQGVYNTKNRAFTSMDMFPTILAAMGNSIEGNRLGLGVNLFSDLPTLAERMGFEKLDTELSKHSEYYMEHFQFSHDGTAQ